MYELPTTRQRQNITMRKTVTSTSSKPTTQLNANGKKTNSMQRRRTPLTKFRQKVIAVLVVTCIMGGYIVSNPARGVNIKTVRRHAVNPDKHQRIVLLAGPHKTGSSTMVRRSKEMTSNAQFTSISFLFHTLNNPSTPVNSKLWESTSPIFYQPCGTGLRPQSSKTSLISPGQGILLP